VVHQAILKEGCEELGRPTSALFWSALAAGLSMGLSMAAEGVLRSHLPDAPWRPLIGKLGYPVGFLVVVLGRQQLYTENTLTAVLPLMVEKRFRTLRNMLRLWGVVALGNLTGAFLFACFVMWTNAFDEGIRHEFARLGDEALAVAFGDVVVRGILAGWMIALIVWLLPFAEAARFFVIGAITYVVGLGELSHVIAGAAEVFASAAAAQKSWWDAFAGFVLPSFIGNTIGGVTLVAALNHAQVVAGGKRQDV
jgi:formate/nitrite transporter FocA (FNT family)